MIIVCDFDNTIANTNQAIIDLYQEITGDLSTSVDDINEWWFDFATPKWDRKQQDLAFTNPRLYELLHPNKDAIEVLTKLHNEGHQLIVCTYHQTDGLKFKADWIHKYLPFIDSIVYIDINNTSLGKSMIKADVIIDDSDIYLNSAKNIKHRICYGNNGWNKNWNGQRVDSWNEFYDIIQTFNIFKRINKQLKNYISYDKLNKKVEISLNLILLFVLTLLISIPIFININNNILLLDNILMTIFMLILIYVNK